MQLITSVIDLEHDICGEGMKRTREEVERHLKYDSISGNLHQFFPSCLPSRSLAAVSSSCAQREKF